VQEVWCHASIPRTGMQQSMHGGDGCCHVRMGVSLRHALHARYNITRYNLIWIYEGYIHMLSGDARMELRYAWQLRYGWLQGRLSAEGCTEGRSKAECTALRKPATLCRTSVKGQHLTRAVESSLNPILTELCCCVLHRKSAHLLQA